MCLVQFAVENVNHPAACKGSFVCDVTKGPLVKDMARFCVTKFSHFDMGGVLKNFFCQNVKKGNKAGKSSNFVT